MSAPSDHRYEVKFIVTDTQLCEVYRWLASHTAMTGSYPDRTVNSLYFDTLNFQSAIENVVGLPLREKFRLRWYGEGGSEAENESESAPRFEIKARNGRLNSKRIMPFVPDGDNSSLADWPLSTLNRLANETLLSSGLARGQVRGRIFPSIFVQYKRAYFSDPAGIRLTIDRAIRYRNVRATRALISSPSIPYSENIVELKFDPAQKHEANTLLKHLSLNPKRSSKYLHGLSRLGLASYV